MLIEKVRKLKPIQRMLYWIQEREKVRLAKEAGEPKPWTDDTILQSYRFCNIRRMDDKVSKWLYENWYKPNFDHPKMLQAVALARFINKPEALEHIGFPTKWNPAALKKSLRTFKVQNGTVFNGAYMIRGNDGIDKIECVVDYYCTPLSQIGKSLDTDTMEATHKRLIECYGLGSFMAGQIVADLRWSVSGRWLDRNDWAPIGPGSKRGMNRLHERELNSPLGQSQFSEELCIFIQDCEDNLPDAITNKLEAMDYQNCLCEFDKYERTLFDNRTPKQKYPGAA